LHDRVDSALPDFDQVATMDFPCVVAAHDPGTVRPWCEAKGIKLRPHVFFGEQTDHIVELDTQSKYHAFWRNWLRDQGGPREFESEAPQLALPPLSEEVEP
jgi:hypothetical protein